MTSGIRREHFHRAAVEIGMNGENDTLPYDIDAIFVKSEAEWLADLAYSIFKKIDSEPRKQADATLNSLNMGSERLLVATGSHGFRITTKNHPFWNMYLNGLGIGITEANEPKRGLNVHSYRFCLNNNNLFDKARSWRSYKEATISDPAIDVDGAVVVQTDISSFYEHIYHHRLENCIDGIFGENSTISTQIDRFLSKMASGRSFGLPVGGQCAHVLAEVMMSPIDDSLSDAQITWHRLVDDFTLICLSQQNAYYCLSTLSNTLADFGLSLNQEKTSILSAKHYKEYVNAQIGGGDEASIALRELDLHFDPYSDAAQNDYSDLK